MTITTAKFQGHGAAVLCLDVSSSQSQSPLLLSGSEDGTARLWDLRDHRRRACLCIRVPGGGDVLSAVFGPSVGASESVEPTTTFPFFKDCTVYLGVASTVVEYDLRHVASPIVCEPPTTDWGNILQHQDEVNQIGLAVYHKTNNNHKKKRNGKKKGNQARRANKGDNNNNNGECSSSPSLYLAACDDAGKARWTEAHNGSTNATSTILHHDPHGVAVVPTCAFRPRSSGSCHPNKPSSSSSSLELATGGTDCKIHLWDPFRPKKPISTAGIHQNETGGAQVCNPPFVYSLAWSPDGESLSAGLGDGTIGVFGMHNRSLVQRHGLVGRRSSSDGTVVQTYAHESSVASVVYPCFSASTANRILCSGGSDGNLVVWDLGNLDDDVGEWDDDDANGETNKGELTKVDDDVSKLFSPDLLRELSGESDDASAATATTTTTTTTTPKILFEIPHGEKINWVTPATASSSSSDNDNVDSRRNTFFVADTSPDITSYTMPF